MQGFREDCVTLDGEDFKYNSDALTMSHVVTFFQDDNKTSLVGAKTLLMILPVLRAFD